MITRSQIEKLKALNQKVLANRMGPGFLRKILAINFRNFRPNESIIFDSPLTAIVGRNGTGKSTVLHLAGCAFAPPVANEATNTAGNTFNKFIPISQRDQMPLNSEYGFVYGDTSSQSYMWELRSRGEKKAFTWDRRGSRDEKRIQRNTIVLGFEKNIPNVFTLSKYFGLTGPAVISRLAAIGTQTQLVALESNTVQLINRITGKAYRKIERRTDRFAFFRSIVMDMWLMANIQI